MRLLVLTWAVCALFVYPVANASIVSDFHNQFEIQTNSHGEKVIVDKSIYDNTSMEVYLDHLATYIQEAENKESLELPTCQGVEYESPDPEAFQTFSRAFKWLRKSNVGGLLKSDKFQSFAEDLAKLTNQSILDKDYPTLANLENPVFFYNKSKSKFFKKQIVRVIKSHMKLAPYLSILTFVSSDYTGHIVNKKIYRQHVLSYYLSNLSAQELGLTDEERGRALSSLEDAQLSFGFKGSRTKGKIKKDFEGYGLASLEKLHVDAEKRWESHASLFDSREETYSHGFSLAVFQGSPLYINLGVKKTNRNQKPSLTYDPECPDLMYKLRKNYELIRVALGLSPIPFSKYLFAHTKSHYHPQSLSEGTFYGYMFSAGEFGIARDLLRQSMNPLLDNE